MRAANEAITTEQAMARFDALEPASTAMMWGRWRGEGIDTGHPMDGLLEASRWHGKAFLGPDLVHPLVHRGLSGRLFNVDPALLPLGLVLRLPYRDAVVGALFPVLGPLLATRRCKARLRTLEFRGRLHAAMCYDDKPIHDVFARIDDDAAMGWMDFKGSARPYFFRLTREAPG